MKMVRFLHPEWDSPLILHPEDPHLDIILDLSPGLDLEKLITEYIDMPESAVNSLPEWDG